MIIIKRLKKRKIEPQINEVILFCEERLKCVENVEGYSPSGSKCLECCLSLVISSRGQLIENCKMPDNIICVNEASERKDGKGVIFEKETKIEIINKEKKMNKKQLKELENLKCLYYGCIDTPGHYAYANGKKISRWWYSWLVNNDGKLSPKNSKKQGSSVLYNLGKYTVLAFWDYTGDSRPGSNSIFVVPGQKSLSEIMDIAYENFQKVIIRQTKPLIIWEKSCSLKE